MDKTMTAAPKFTTKPALWPGLRNVYVDGKSAGTIRKYPDRDGRAAASYRYHAATGHVGESFATLDECIASLKGE